MEEIENNVIPKDINIVSTDISEFPEVTFENIKSTEVINYFGKLPTQEAVMSYYMYLTEKAKKFRMSSECKPIFDYAKKVKLNHIKDWNNNPNIRVTNNKQDLPKWVTFNARGNAIINETIYCKQKIAQKDIRTIGGKIYNIDGEVKESGLRREIIDDISPYVTSGLSRMVEALYSAIKIFTYSEMPDADAKKIHVLNGAIDISKFKTTGQFLFSPNKEWCVNRLSVKFNPDAKHPVKFLKLLDELLEKDDIKTLQEYMGYGFIPSTIAQKLLFIVGNGGEGKSLLGNIYKQVIGAHNTYSAHIQKLQNKPCELANCINKLMNIDDDTEAKAFEDTGTLKEIISGGSVTVEPKYVQPYSTTLYTRLMCFSNASLQALYDRSDGFYRRQLIIRTKPKAKNRVDNPNLMNEIVAEELEGIFLWCLDGLKRLISNNFIFTVSEKSKHLVEQSQREGFNFIEYLEDTNEIAFEETQATTSVDLYSAYCNWCHQNGKDIIKRNVVLGWLKDHSNKYNIKDDCNVIDRNSGRRCRGFKGIRVIRSYNQNVCCA
jgi:putative DNA primase/helicase